MKPSQTAMTCLEAGDVPMYLEQLKKGLSAVQNIQDICFDPNGYLYDEFDRLFASFFDNYQQHVAVIRALASCRNGLTRQEIIANAKFTNGGMLSDILGELEQSGFISVYNGYGKKVKESLYRLTDFYTHFYLTFIETLGKHSKVNFKELSDLPKWKTWSGYAYENICHRPTKLSKRWVSMAYLPQLRLLSPSLPMASMAPKLTCSLIAVTSASIFAK
jgi:uncharacterized protein